MANPTNRESDKFMLRLPEGMRERIKAAAEAAHRSMNAEIVARLEESFLEPESLVPPEVTLDAEEEERMNKIMMDFADLLLNRKERQKR